MQSKVLCLLFVTLVASSVTAGSIGETIESVRKAGHAAKNASHQLGEVPVIVLPPIPNIIQMPEVASGVEKAEVSLTVSLGGTKDLAAALENAVAAALQSTQSVADLINVLTQIINAFVEVAATEALNSALLILNSGLQVVSAVLSSVMVAVNVNILI